MIGRLLATALAVLLPSVAAAHSEHGDPTSVGSQNVFAVQGYRVEVLSHPSPLTRGHPSHVVTRVLTIATLAPAIGGRVLIGVAPAGTVGEAMLAPEHAQTGTYAVAVTPERTGAHQVRVLIVELEGQRFEPPLAVEFQVQVERAPAMGGWAWTVLALLGGGVAATLYLVGVQARTARSTGEATNLLEVRWLRRALTSRVLQPALQIPLLLLAGIVVFLGIQDVQNGGVNLATKLSWTIWWAGVIFTFFLVGRVWCLACPFGALNEWASRLAGPVRRLPRPFRNLWWATAMFVLLTWADEQLGVVRSPVITAALVLFFAALAVAVGLGFERRSFCRYLCPIGGVIGLYSMTAPVELRVGQAATCRTHTDKVCYRGGADVRGCPMFEFPQSMDRNTYCTFCAECVRGCSRNNLVLRLRAFGQDLWASSRRHFDEAYLAVALVGLTLFVTAQMLTAWPEWISALGRGLPDVLSSPLDLVTYRGLIESVVLLGGTLVVAPGLLLAAVAVAERLAGPHRLGLRRAFAVFGYALIPIALAMHLAHNLGHLLLEGGTIVPVVQRAVARWTPWSVGVPDWTPAPLAPDPVIGLLQVIVIAVFFALSLMASHRLAQRVYGEAGAASRALIPVAVLSLIFTVAGIVLLQQPMGMRHGM